MKLTTAMMEKPQHTRFFKTLHSFGKISLTGTSEALFSAAKKNVQDQPTWLPSFKGWWNAQEVSLSICEAKLKEVNGHARARHQASEGRIQLTTHPSGRQRLIPSPLQTDEDVQ